ncbi:type I-E CRISPR-associated protein Cse1/CasA [Streptomyces sp. AA1529]|uniref:type I-E CRISPR-associated protein Cse1/CasA n=1 Tax=Streptomyces sp. AA1529 TaxID=1203257 RepID=UPI003D7449DD
MFNLVDEAWIPAQHADGHVARVSLRTALVYADELVSLPVEPSTLLPAVLRQTLLPLMLGALGAPGTLDEWSVRHAEGRFSERERKLIDDHLDDQRSAFELFDEKWPFAQVGGLEAASGDTKPVSLLIPSVATGNNVPMFTAFAEAYPFSLSPQDAALWLLHAHCWDTAAIKTGARGDGQAAKGKTTGNPTGPLGQFGVIVPAGATLYETLILNTPVVPDGLSSEDRPQWQAAESGGPGWEARAALGLLDALTWQSRRIRLIPRETSGGLHVDRVVVCAGDRITAVRTEFEWHTAWTYTAKPKKGQAPLRPRRHRSGEHAWQGLATLLALGREEDGDGPRTSGLLQQIGKLETSGRVPPGLPLQLHTCGLVYGNQSAIVDDALADSLPLPVAALAADSRTRTAVLDAVEQADQTAQALNRLSADLRRAEGAEPVAWDKGQRPSVTFLQAVDVPMRRLLRGLQQASTDEERIEQGMEAWEQILSRLAWVTAHELLAAASPVSFLGRQKDGRTFRAALAMRSFGRTLNEILTREAQARQARSDATESAEDEA